MFKQPFAFSTHHARWWRQISASVVGLLLVVPFTPGGVTDTSGRLIAEQLSKRLGQQVVLDNKPGASGNIGTQMVATAEPDGYTLLLGFDGTMVINPNVFPKVVCYQPLIIYQRICQNLNKT